MHEQTMDKSTLAMKTFVFGAVLGSIAAILFAPKSGRETRAQIKQKAEEAKEKAKNKRDELMEKVQRGKDEAEAKADEVVVSEARRRANSQA